MREAMIALRAVGKTYFAGMPLPVLREVTLAIGANEYLAIMGPSGSGKSTLLHLMGLLDRPTSGRIWFQGRDTGALSDGDLSRLRGRAIGFVFQSFHLVAHLNAVENVELPLFYQGVPPARRRARAQAMVERVGLAHRASHLPAELSGGECQRVAIARALVPEPSVILADEPTGNLDSHSGAEILGLFDRFHAEGKTVILVTHDATIAARVPRVIRMADGAILQESA